MVAGFGVFVPAGYSGTPLVKKLGIKAGHRVHFASAPEDYAATLGALPEAVVVKVQARAPLDVIQLFTRSRRDLERRGPAMLARLAPGGMLWVSWPKRSSGVETDVTEDVIRDVLLPTGWVDVKVCAVDETWSGLKFLKRRS